MFEGLHREVGPFFFIHISADLRVRPRPFLNEFHTTDGSTPIFSFESIDGSLTCVWNNEGTRPFTFSLTHPNLNFGPSALDQWTNK